MMAHRTGLARYGWDAAWEQTFADHAEAGAEPARVTLAHTHIYTVVTESGDRLARVTGRYRHIAREQHDFPVVGDWVFGRLEQSGERMQIRGLLPRRTRVTRKVAGETTGQQVVAANIDTIFIVMGCDADFNLRRLERYLVLTRESGAAPVVILNKADRVADPQVRKEETRAVVPDVPIHLLSAKTGLGFDELARELHPGRTIALLGSSGVGKSSIINRFVGHEVLRTADVRQSDERGRHTTRHRQLVRLANGAMVIDSPGMRELQLWEATDGLNVAFDDIEAVAGGCRFRDCTHRSEPGCAVREAVESRVLPPERLEGYLKLAEERRRLEERIEEKRWREKR
jgi:ribosome biogenesis GTPase